MKRMLSLALCLLMCLALLPAVPAFAAGDVAINETNFPDETVRGRVKGYFDTDKNGKLSAAEIKTAVELSFGPEGSEVTSLKGIEFLTELKHLYLSESQITEIDVSKNTKLENLNLWLNKSLTKLDVSKNTNLVNLTFNGSQLTEIDVSKNTKLSSLNCYGNPLTKLDMSKNTKLVALYASETKVTKLDVSGLPDLKVLYCGDTSIKTLDLSNNTKLKELYVADTGLKSLDISMCPTLVECVRNSPIDATGDGYTRYMYNDARVTINKGFHLYIDPKATITAQPKSVSAEDGTTVSFRTAAEGSIWVEYQWQYRTSPTGDWYKSTLSGYNTAELKVRATSARSGYQYRCKVINRSSAPVYTQPATLTVAVTKAPVISTQPKDIGAGKGETVSFKVASPNSGLSYQWQYRVSENGLWDNCSNGKSATLSVEAKAYRNGYQYRCKVTNKVGTTISNIATLRVGTKPTMTAQPESVTLPVGRNAVFSVAASGPELSYQWQYKERRGDSWYNCSNGTAATLTVAVKSYRDGYQYRCQITNPYGKVISDAATLQTLKKPEIESMSPDVTAKAGETVSFWVKTKNADSYQWYYSPDGGENWYKCTGESAMTDTLLVEARSYRNWYYYRCKVTNEAGSITSAARYLIVEEAD